MITHRTIKGEAFCILFLFLCGCISNSGYENTRLIETQMNAAKKTKKFEKAFEEIVADEEMPFIFSIDEQAAELLPAADKEIYETLPAYITTLVLIQEKYVRSVSTEDLSEASLKGMCAALDDYCDFLTEEEYASLKRETNGEYSGIGLVVGVHDGYLTVIAPIEGSPSDKAGIKAGDRVIKVNDIVVSDLELFEAVEYLRGESGSEVSLTIKRRSVAELIDVTLMRGMIEIQSVKPMRLLRGDIAYVRMIEFDAHASELLEEELERVEEGNARALILDLRNNPGGLLSAGVEVAHYFLDKNEIIVTAQGREAEEVLRVVANGERICPDIPIAVLINQGSASASEIIAAAIRDHGHGLIVGERSFGKGSVQMVIPFKNKTAIRLTVAMYFTPNGECIDKQGIEPDVEVEHAFVDKTLVSDDPYSEAYLLNDKQIIAALDVLDKAIAQRGDVRNAA
ncbi:MAG: S41 family peptidase [Candidatus Omnitrophica bacterium]|nr:S41 family peptidase [Candidatus Omnitrophota bacterium]